MGRELWTHHGYAVNVKDRSTYQGWDVKVEGLDLLGEDEVQALYEQAQEMFWCGAQDIGKEHGFDQVYSEGRMGGWAKPNPQPHTDDMWEDEVEKWEQETFLPFKRDIEAEVEHRRETFLDDLREAVAERKQANRNNSLAAAGWRF